MSAVLANLFNRLDDLKDVLKLGLKDIIGSITYAFKLSITYDEEKLNTLIRNRRITLDRIASEYQRQWKQFIDHIGPGFSTMTFLIAPGPYLAAYLSLNARADLGAIVEFLKDAGVPTSYISEIFDLSGVDSSDDGVTGRDTLALLLTRRTDGTQRSELENILRQINQKLEDLYGIRREDSSRSRTPPSEERVEEGVQLVRSMLSNNKKVLKESVYESLTKNAIQKLNDENETISRFLKIDSKALVDEKIAQYKENEEIKNGAKLFIQKMENAKSLEDIEASYELLKKIPFEIDGLETNPMDRVKKIVDANYIKIKDKKEELKKLIEFAGMTVEDVNKIDERDAKKAILMIQIKKEIENFKKTLKDGKFNKILDELDRKLDEEFLKDLDLKMINKMNFENSLLKLIKDVENKNKR